MDRINFDVDRAIEMNKSGKTVAAIARELGINKSVIHRRFKSIGYEFIKFPSIDPALWSEVASLYRSGQSELAVSKRFGCSRTAIRRILVKLGVHVRSRSESEALKWSLMSEEQRANQVKAAHEAAANQPPESFKAAAIKQAKTKEKSLAKSCDMERIFISAFNERGYDVIPQKAVGPYNIDLAIRGTAVEVHGNAAHAHTHPYFRKRVMYLLECGWNVIYIKTIGNLSVESATNKVCRMIDLIESDKSPVRHYGMVRGSGEFVTSGCFDGNELATVDGPYGLFDGIE